MARVLATRWDSQRFCTSVETCQFIENELSRDAPAPSDARYRLRGTALYTLYRHGLIHQREPGRLDVDGTEVLWQVNFGRARDEHLTLRELAAKRLRFARWLDSRGGRSDGYARRRCFRLISIPTARATALSVPSVGLATPRSIFETSA